MFRMAIRVFLTTVLLLAGTHHVLASGAKTSSSRPSSATRATSYSRPSTGRMQGPVHVLEGNLYDQGEDLFKGKKELQVRTDVDRDAQWRRLSALQEKLPKHVKKKSNLTSLAGKLSAEEFRTLEYYLDNRYGIK